MKKKNNSPLSCSMRFRARPARFLGCNAFPLLAITNLQLVPPQAQSQPGDSSLSLSGQYTLNHHDCPLSWSKVHSYLRRTDAAPVKLTHVTISHEDISLGCCCSVLFQLSLSPYSISQFVLAHWGVGRQRVSLNLTSSLSPSSAARWVEEDREMERERERVMLLGSGKLGHLGWTGVVGKRQRRSDASLSKCNRSERKELEFS